LILGLGAIYVLMYGSDSANDRYDSARYDSANDSAND